MSTLSPNPNAAGSNEVPSFPDQLLEEKVKRMSEEITKGILNRLPDEGAKFRSILDLYTRELEQRRNAGVFYKNFVLQDIGQCQGIMQSNSESHGMPEEIFTPRTKSNSQEEVSDEAGIPSNKTLGSLSHNKNKNLVKNRSRVKGEKLTLRNSPKRASDCQYKSKQKSSQKKLSDDDYSLPKRRKPSLRQGSKKLKFEEVQPVVLLDDEDAKVTDSIQAGDHSKDNREHQNIFYPSRGDPECVELSPTDLKCLDPESYLSSPIMNFYIRYLQSLSTRRKDCHIFNTYFYSKLEETMTCKGNRTMSFLKLRRWWKGVDIFEKAYILLPIHGDMHWSLAIICVPAKEDESRLIILHLDSLSLHRSKHIFTVVSNYLKEEWNYIKQNSPLQEPPISEKIWKHLPRRIDTLNIAVPQQENEYDCGLFVLYIIQQFIQEAPERIRKKDLTMFGKKWFRPEDASALRTIMKELLVKEFELNSENETRSSSPDSSPADNRGEKCN